MNNEIWKIQSILKYFDHETVHKNMVLIEHVQSIISDSDESAKSKRWKQLCSNKNFDKF